ncbi:MAG TPA: dipeptide epimerase [Blastocatellia bacterium]|nr:dipeptide epimerase [Blastocatellia bacterium]
MRIVDVSVFRRDFQLRNPSVVAYESVEVAPNVIVRVEVENGLVGWGNAAPDEHVTGENADGVERTLRERLSPFLLGQDASRIEAIWPQLCRLAANQPTAVAAVDIALYDLLGKAAGLPVCQLLGNAKSKLETTVTLSIEELPTTLARAKDFQAQGFRALKVKCGLNPDEDVDRVRQLRRTVGSQIRLTLDANQGYSVAESLRMLEAVKECRIDFIEQPVAATDIEALRELCQRSPIPVMADESVLSAADVLKTPASLVNLKLMKTGGITGALKANAVAEARGIRAMVGCMDESRISMAAAAHFALAMNNIVYGDLDGHIDIVDDAAEQGIMIENGFVLINERAGLGLVVEHTIA